MLTEQNEKEELDTLKQKLAHCESSLQDERNRRRRLEAEALYVQTAFSKFVPHTSYLHPTATACEAEADETDEPAPAADAGAEDNVTISREAYELLQLKDRAMDSIKEGITIADCSLPDMPLIYVNQGFERITGWPVAEVLGKNCRFLQGDSEDENLQQLRQAVNRGEACQVTLTNYRKNGDAFVNYLSITPVHNQQGLLTHYVGVQSDITELVNHKKAELAAKHQAVQAAAATEAKSQFLARMSHEIRTPLNGMIAVGQLLGETNLTASQMDLLNTIRCSGETLLILITDILDFSRIEANKMVLSLQRFRLRTVVESALEIAGLAAAQKRIQVCYHIASDVPASFLGDAQRLQQILLNVLNNAVKFTERGEVLLEVWMGATEESRLESTGYPLEVVKGFEDHHRTLEGLRSRGGLPKPSESMASIRRENVETFIRAESGSAMPGTPTTLKELRTSSQTDLLPDSPLPPSSPDQGSASLSSGYGSDAREEEACSQGSPRLASATQAQTSEAPPPPGREGASNPAGSNQGSELPETQRHTACGRVLPLVPGPPAMTHVLNFAVRDTGIGISPADMGNLFKIFSQVDSSRTRQHGGSGLGLSICKKLVEAMGGKMWATSPGKKRGSTFHFTICCPKDVSGGSHQSRSSSSSSYASSTATSRSRTRSSDAGGPSPPAQNCSGSAAKAPQGPVPAVLESRPVEVNGKPPSQPPLPTNADVSSPRPNGRHEGDAEVGAEAVPSGELPAQHGKSSKKKNIKELRQMLSDTLPGSSDSASASKKPSSELTFRNSLGSDPRGPAKDPARAPREVANGKEEAASGSASASEKEAGAAKAGSIQGKKVLLVEPHDSVRHCMLLFLRARGALVKAVCSEDHAIACLRLQGAVTRKASYEQFPRTFSGGPEGSTTSGVSEGGNPSLALEHAPELPEVAGEEVVGPFDVVVTDVKQSRVCKALIQSAPSEAQRLVFMSWPGEQDLEKLTGQPLPAPEGTNPLPLPDTAVDPHSLISQRAVRGPPQPPKAVREDMRHRTTTRQLGYVTIFRPIRQERLKLAIEEVLRTPLIAVSSGTDGYGLCELKSLSRTQSRHSSTQDLRRSIHSSSSSSMSHMTLPRNLRVLLAEDNSINLKVALGILQRIGFSDIVCAADGVKAISEITARGGGEAFDIVLTDLHMPRKGGMELVKEIRETWPESNIKVVAVTADAFEDTRNLCMAAGFDGWLAKPFRIQDLARVMDQVLANRSPYKSPASQIL